MTNLSKMLTSSIAVGIVLGAFFGGAYSTYLHQQETAMVHRTIPPFPTSSHVTDECRKEMSNYNKALLQRVYRTSDEQVAEPRLSRECYAQMSYYYTGPSIKDVYR